MKAIGDYVGGIFLKMLEGNHMIGGWGGRRNRNDDGDVNGSESSKNLHHS